ncbi:MAG: ACP S-malonyltransferase [Anaerolineae bacterium]|nr:ACP S-malonyltransferase [Anaerolineae bacterium]
MSIVLLFPGQGSQYVGMGLKYYRASEEARVLYQQAEFELGYALAQLCSGGPDEQLNKTEFTQPAIFVVTLAMWSVLKHKYPSPAFVMGHSLGEFAALFVAGVFDFLDGLHLVMHRARLMAKVGRCVAGGMVAVLGTPLASIRALCEDVACRVGEPLGIASDNSPKQVVISGTESALTMAQQLAPEYGIRRMQRLPVSVAAHCSLMREVRTEFAQILAGITLHNPKIPVILNTTARPTQDLDLIRSALVDQLTSLVRWRESLLNVALLGGDHFVEVGPGTVLSGLVKHTLSHVSIEAVDG